MQKEVRTLLHHVHDASTRIILGRLGRECAGFLGEVIPVVIPIRALYLDKHDLDAVLLHNHLALGNIDRLSRQETTMVSSQERQWGNGQEYKK